jgi:hypothetical protein
MVDTCAGELGEGGEGDGHGHAVLPGTVSGGLGTGALGGEGSLRYLALLAGSPLETPEVALLCYNEIGCLHTDTPMFRIRILDIFFGGRGHFRLSIAPAIGRELGCKLLNYFLAFPFHSISINPCVCKV